MAVKYKSLINAVDGASEWPITCNNNNNYVRILKSKIPSPCVRVRECVCVCGTGAGVVCMVNHVTGSCGWTGSSAFRPHTRMLPILWWQRTRDFNNNTMLIYYNPPPRASGNSYRSKETENKLTQLEASNSSLFLSTSAHLQLPVGGGSFIASATHLLVRCFFYFNFGHRRGTGGYVFAPVCLTQKVSDRFQVKPWNRWLPRMLVLIQGNSRCAPLKAF